RPQVRGEGVGDRLRSTTGEGHPHSVGGGVEEDADGARHRVLERQERVSGEAGECTTRMLGAERTPAEDGGGQYAGGAEPRQREGMTGYAQHVVEPHGGEDVPLLGRPPDETSPSSEERRVGQDC